MNSQKILKLPKINQYPVTQAKHALPSNTSLKTQKNISDNSNLHTGNSVLCTCDTEDKSFNDFKNRTKSLPFPHIFQKRYSEPRTHFLTYENENTPKNANESELDPWINVDKRSSSQIQDILKYHLDNNDPITLSTYEDIQLEHDKKPIKVLDSKPQLNRRLHLAYDHKVNDIIKKSHIRSKKVLNIHKVHDQHHNAFYKESSSMNRHNTKKSEITNHESLTPIKEKAKAIQIGKAEVIMEDKDRSKYFIPYRKIDMKAGFENLDMLTENGLVLHISQLSKGESTSLQDKIIEIHVNEKNTSDLELAKRISPTYKKQVLIPKYHVLKGSGKNSIQKKSTENTIGYLESFETNKSNIRKEFLTEENDTFDSVNKFLSFCNQNELDKDIKKENLYKIKKIREDNSLDRSNFDNEIIKSIMNNIDYNLPSLTLKLTSNNDFSLKGQKHKSSKFNLKDLASNFLKSKNDSNSSYNLNFSKMQARDNLRIDANHTDDQHNFDIKSHDLNHVFSTKFKYIDAQKFLHKSPSKPDKKGFLSPVEDKLSPIESKISPKESKISPIESKMSPIENKIFQIESRYESQGSKQVKRFKIWYNY